MYTSTIEIRLVESALPLISSEISSKTVRNHKLMLDSSMLQILVPDHLEKYMSSRFKVQSSPAQAAPLLTVLEFGDRDLRYTALSS